MRPTFALKELMRSSDPTLKYLDLIFHHNAENVLATNKDDKYIVDDTFPKILDYKILKYVQGYQSRR